MEILVIFEIESSPLFYLFIVWLNSMVLKNPHIKCEHKTAFCKDGI